MDLNLVSFQQKKKSRLNQNFGHYFKCRLICRTEKGLGKHCSLDKVCGCCRNSFGLGGTSCDDYCHK